MDELTVLTWRIPVQSAAEVEAATVPEKDREALLLRLRQELGAQEMVYLPTCQRVALVLLRPPQDAAARVQAAYRGIGGREVPAPEAFQGRDAFLHLAETAASLDSLVLGEPQILGQVKTAAQRCDETGLSGPGLRHVLGLVLRAAKTVRAETGLFKGKVSLVPLTEQVIADHLEGVASPRAVVFGTGQIGTRMVELLRARPGLELHVVSRDADRARAAAAAHDATPHALEAFLRALPVDVDVVALAMGTDAPVLRTEDVARMAGGRHILVLDLAIPRNVESAPLPQARIVQMDDLGRMSEEAKRARQDEVQHAQRLLAVEMDRIEAAYADRKLAHDLEALARRFALVGDEHWEKAAGEGIDATDPRVRKWYEQTLRALLHEATSAVKKAGCEPKK